jgi:hypothetical protein
MKNNRMKTTGRVIIPKSGRNENKEPNETFSLCHLSLIASFRGE